MTTADGRKRRVYTVDDARILQRFLNRSRGPQEIRLVIFSKEHDYRIIYKGEPENFGAHFNLHMYLQAGHYNYLHRPAQLFGVSV